MASDPAVAALAAVATARVDALEDEVRSLRTKVDALQTEASERRGRDSMGARLVPWLALLVSAAVGAHALGIY